MPDYDDERVYVSDIKKVLSWYNLLHQLGLLEVKEVEEKPDEDVEGKENAGTNETRESKEKRS